MSKKRSRDSSANTTDDMELHVCGDVRLDAQGHVRSAQAKATWDGAKLHVDNTLRTSNTSIIDGVVIRSNGPITYSHGSGGPIVNGMPLRDFITKQQEKDRKAEREMRTIDIDVSKRRLRRLVVTGGNFVSEHNTDADTVETIDIDAKNSSKITIRMPQMAAHTTTINAKNSSVVTIDFTGRASSST